MGKTEQEMSLEEIVKQFREQGPGAVVFTNGCFDLLHVGHVHVIREAARLGDLLIVAFNDDESLKRLKGPNRPIVPYWARKRMLHGIKGVDLVVSFTDNTPERLLEELRPDFLVKGAVDDESERPDGVVGAEFVESYGGEVRLVHKLAGFSTTEFYDKLRREF